MLRHVTTAAPVLVNRSAFTDLVALARRTANDRSVGLALADAVLALEAERHRVEWDENDAVPIGLYAGDEQGYLRYREVPPEVRNNPGQPPLKTLWRRGDLEITVVDQLPIPADRMACLVSLGIAQPRLLALLADAAPPFNFFYVCDPRWGKLQGPMAVEKVAGPPGGAWIVAGVNREPFAWVGTDIDATYVASALNMSLELEMDVTRGSTGRYDFPARVCGSGIVGLIRMLRRSIEPEEPWEAEPSETLRAAGAELQKRLLEFLAQARPHRFKQREENWRDQR